MLLYLNIPGDNLKLLLSLKYLYNKLSGDIWNAIYDIIKIVLINILICISWV